MISNGELSDPLCESVNRVLQGSKLSRNTHLMPPKIQFSARVLRIVYAKISSTIFDDKCSDLRRFIFR